VRRRAFFFAGNKHGGQSFSKQNITMMSKAESTSVLYRGEAKIVPIGHNTNYKQEAKEVSYRSVAIF
jgi:hypothetical protein